MKEKMEQKYNLFVDMDGVLVDFNKGYFELTGTDISDKYQNSAAFWEPIDRAGITFWEDLNWTEDGKRLWDYVEKYGPTILSSPSRKNDSRVGKHAWVKRELPNAHLILRTANDKKEFACPHCILIDDLQKNIDSWNESGGIGILHTSADDTIKQLKNLKL